MLTRLAWFRNLLWLRDQNGVTLPAMPTSKGEGEVLITVAVPEKLKNEVRAQAALQGTTFKAVLAAALKAWLRDAKRRRR